MRLNIQRFEFAFRRLVGEAGTNNNKTSKKIEIEGNIAKSTEQIEKMNRRPQREQLYNDNPHQGMADGNGTFQSTMQANSDKAKLSPDDRLRLTLQHLRIGESIHQELKAQGRSVTWLATQLGMERSSLYYTFKQNIIALDFLIRISILLDHNFVQDVLDVYNTYNP